MYIDICIYLYIAEGQLHLKWHRTIFGPTEQQNTRLVQNAEARRGSGSPRQQVTNIGVVQGSYIRSRRKYSLLNK